MVLSVLLTIQACSGPLDLITGGGPNIAANTQLGKENTQTIGSSTQNKFAPQSITLPESTRPQARPTQVEQVQNQTNNELPTWMWILGIVLFVVGWVTDTPNTILRDLRRK
jgi:hypothetical protein